MSKINYEFGSLENGVLFGGDDHLFLADGGHSVLDYVTGRRNVDPGSILDFAANISTRQSICSKNETPYLHVVFPDKQSVLPQFFPIANPVCLGEVYLKNSPNIVDSVFYPRSLLGSLGTKSFQKTDTHLSDIGTIIVAKAVLDRFFSDLHLPQIQKIIEEANVAVEWTGDLGQRFSPAIKETKLVHRNGPRLRWLSNDLTGGNNGMIDILFNNDALYPKRLLIFGDSFGRELARFLGMFIKEVVFLRTPFFHVDMYEQIMPDLVITDNVERYLSSCAHDDNRPTFLMYPFLGEGKYSPSKEFCRALSAVMSFPRRPYQDYMKEIQNIVF